MIKRQRFEVRAGLEGKREGNRKRGTKKRRKKRGRRRKGWKEGRRKWGEGKHDGIKSLVKGSTGSESQGC